MSPQATPTETPIPADLPLPEPQEAELAVGEVVESDPGEPPLAPPTEDLNPPEEVEAPEPEMEREPSLENYQQAIQAKAISETNTQGAQYPEDTDPNLTQALNQTSAPWKNKIRDLGNMSPRDRAVNGALLGSGVGASLMGPTGAVVGATIGGVIGRGAGLAQSGELAAQNRDNRIWNSLKSLGAVSPEGIVEFENSTVQVPAESTGRLRNLRINPLTGARDRSLYETDKTNPLTGRAMLVAKPLGMFFASGMLGYGDKSEIDTKAKDSASALFANILTEGTSSEDVVYSRAQQLVKKMGVKPEDVRGFFDTVKTKISFTEAEGIKAGLDILLAKPAKKK